MAKKKFQYELANTDMKEFYDDVLCENIDCPEIIVVKEIENGSGILRLQMENGESIYYLKHSDDMFDVLIDELQNGGADHVKAHSFENHNLTNDEVWTWISIAVDIADRLGVRCPQIVFTPYEDAGNFGGEGLLVLPGIKPDSKLNIIEMFVSIAHELRHEWQHAHHPIWFKDYVQVESEKDMEKYLNHKTEIDAEAYARKLADLVFDVYLFQGGDESFMKKLIKRAEKIEIDISEEDIEDLRMLFDENLLF